MKLRNRRTGEMCELKVTVNGDLAITKDDEITNICSSLAELNEEWEDYEEPEGWWFIDRVYEPHATNSTLRNLDADREIGNYFETREEAEEAVEKLKAWKRLKDKGFRFACYMKRSDWTELSQVKALENLIDITAYLPKDKIKEMEVDLNLLFGGEE